MDLSFVFPCLNESETLSECIQEVIGELAQSDLEWEVIVADNGSEDDSVDIAVAEGARVVSVPQRGYGAAVNGGILEAKGLWVAFADADGSYRVGDIMTLYEEAQKTGADMVIASRMTGVIERGAMPFLHRYVGTPILTKIINVLYSGKLSDCNSGFRLIKRDAYQSWSIKSTGMEFASELLIKALKAQADLVEIESGLRPDKRSSGSHLRTWRDGMRHLLFILSERPELFEWVGGFLVVMSTLLQTLAFAVGPIQVGAATVLSFHTQAMLLPLACTGVQLYLISCFLFVTDESGATHVTKKLIRVGEAELFFGLLFLLGLQMAAFSFVLWSWSQVGYGQLLGPDLIQVILFLVHLMAVIGFFGVGLLGLHIHRKKA